MDEETKDITVLLTNHMTFSVTTISAFYPLRGTGEGAEKQ